MKDTMNYNHLVGKLRRFFQDEKGYIEVPVQSRLSPLLACEDPETIAMFTFRGEQYPLPQSAQPELEVEILTRPNIPGVFCVTTSFRDEPVIIPGRHETVFPLFEFEGRGGFEDLKKIESDYLAYLGFERPIELDYEDACKFYKTDIITAEHEAHMQKDFGTAVLLQNFPTRSHPYWNMKYAGDGIFRKVDVILYGMESAGSAERSCNVDEMKHYFTTVSNGDYARLLLEKLGKERVMKELDNYMALPMTPRFGAGIGIHRTVRAMQLAGLDYDASYNIPTTTFKPATLSL